MSKTKRNGGYYLADLSGVVLNPASFDQRQEITHSVVADIKEAIKNNKPILLANLKMQSGPSSYLDITPVPCFVYSVTENNVIASFSIYSFLIEKDGDTEYATLSSLT